MDYIPKEFTMWGIYMPPLLIASILGLLLAFITIKIFNHYRWSRFFYQPSLILIALTIIFTVIIGEFFIPF